MAKSMPWRHRLGWLMATALTLGFISASCPAADEEGSTDAAVAVDSSEAATATQPQAENDAGEQEAQQQEQQEEQLDESTASAQDDPTDTRPLPNTPTTVRPVPSDMIPQQPMKACPQDQAWIRRHGPSRHRSPRPRQTPSLPRP